MIVGPTAVGKSRIAIEVAKAFETEVLTADSRQVYRGMDVGTDKPSIATSQGIPHRLIDLVDPDESFNAGLYRRQAIDEIERLYQTAAFPWSWVARGSMCGPSSRACATHHRPIRLCGRTCGKRRMKREAIASMRDLWRSILYGRAAASTRRIESDPCAGGAPTIRLADV